MLERSWNLNPEPSCCFPTPLQTAAPSGTCYKYTLFIPLKPFILLLSWSVKLRSWKTRLLSAFSIFTSQVTFSTSLIFHVAWMRPVFPDESGWMLLMPIGSFSQQAPPCAPDDNKRSCCLLQPINQTNATIGTKLVCKCTWAFLTCSPVYVAEGVRGVHPFMSVCVSLRPCVLYGWMDLVNSRTEMYSVLFAHHGIYCTCGINEVG